MRLSPALALVTRLATAPAVLLAGCEAKLNQPTEECRARVRKVLDSRQIPISTEVVRSRERVDMYGATDVDVVPSAGGGPTLASQLAAICEEPCKVRKHSGGLPMGGFRYSLPKVEVNCSE